nr:putative reverse transcriptase domain-containing protein [Tanacetum cinerariifolium]
ANVVADALSRKSGMIAGIKVEEEIIRDLEREALLTEAHSSPFSVHPGSTKMYHDLKQYFWWSGMKRDVAMFVSKCLVCQQVKIKHQQASGLLQQLDIPDGSGTKYPWILLPGYHRLRGDMMPSGLLWIV